MMLLLERHGNGQYLRIVGSNFSVLLFFKGGRGDKGMKLFSGASLEEGEKHSNKRALALRRVTKIS